MEHRHLLPEEIDLLLDGEVGFGIAPLQAHIRSCDQCRTELESAREVAAALEHLPHFAPSSLFAEKVMAQVQVIEPVHVAATESVRRWLPQSRPMRVIAGVGGLSIAAALSFVSIWLIGNLDGLLFFGRLLGDRTRSALFNGVGSAVAGSVGEPAMAALRSAGAFGVVAVGLGFVLALVGAAVGLRAVAGASRRSRG